MDGAREGLGEAGPGGRQHEAAPCPRHVRLSRVGRQRVSERLSVGALGLRAV